MCEPVDLIVSRVPLAKYEDLNVMIMAIMLMMVMTLKMVMKMTSSP